MKCVKCGTEADTDDRRILMQLGWFWWDDEPDTDYLCPKHSGIRDLVHNDDGSMSMNFHGNKVNAYPIATWNKKTKKWEAIDGKKAH